MNTEPGGLGKRLRYASRMGFPYVVVIGEDEVSSGSVSIKDMAMGATESLSVDEVVRFLSNR